MRKYLMMAAVVAALALSGCGNSRAEEAVKAYEDLADELVEARANGNYQRQLELATQLAPLSAKYSDVKADDLSDEQRERVAVAMQKIISGGYQEMIENLTAPPAEGLEEETEE